MSVTGLRWPRPSSAPAAGLAGQGATAPPGLDAEEAELPYIIPGPKGERGCPGSQGPPGMDAEEAELPYFIPG